MIGVSAVAQAIMIAVMLGACATSGFGQGSMARAMGEYLKPYVQTGNFSGNALVERDGKILFQESYGYADREHRIRNTPRIRFHIASMSMQFTAVAALQLVEKGAIRLDEHVSDFTEGVEGADRITVRDLLTERSGLPDTNALPNYEDEILQHPQTPSSLIEAIAGRPLLFEPGSKFMHEEHSAYNLLAFIIEKKTGTPFGIAMKRFFTSIGLADSGVDDDSATASSMAKGYEPEGAYGLEPAKAIHWSGKAGNGSAYSTIGDEAKWLGAFFGSQLLSPALRDQVLDTSTNVGYGWFKGENQRFGQTAYYMNGRSPGFGSFLLYLPKEHLAVILLGNIYSSATTTIGYDLAALGLGLPYKNVDLARRALSAQELNSYTGTFQFGPDFYQPNAKLSVVVDGRDLTLRWPSGSSSFLLPLARDRFMDRAYWQELTFQRSSLGHLSALSYDRFKGEVLEEPGRSKTSSEGRSEQLQRR
jgi:CubicO group peptidase (beta-lactamase class C family)